MLTQLRNQFGAFWGKQSKVQRIVLITLVALVLVLVPLFMVWASTPTYAVAFNGLSETDAASIVEKLKENGTLYQLRNSNTILVPSSQVYDVRLQMASAGLPQGGTVGFELFSGTTLGMTEFTQRVNYQRALEGELERTIGSLNTVDAVRVHIVTPEKTLLASEQVAPTASVTIKEKPGASLDTAQVTSITHLVASAVEGMQPENVVVVDVNGNMLASGDTSSDANSSAQSDSQRVAETLAARELQRKVQDLLDKSLGPNKSVVQTSVTLDWTQREKTTQSYDPITAAIRSSQDVTETYTTTNTTLAGVPGATSNLPTTVAGGTTTNGGNVNYNREESTKNYELTQIESHEVEAPGAVKRIALSVLVDGVTDAQQLATLKNVIAAAAGIDQTRGDLLAVETLAFDHTYTETQAADLAASQKNDLYFQIGTAVAIVLALALLMWYIQRLLANLRLRNAEAWTPILRPVAEMALPGAMGSMGPSLVGREMPAMPQIDSSIARVAPEPVLPEPKQIQLPKIDIPALSEEDEKLAEILQELADREPANVASIIQLWLSEDDRRNG
jgi:flagellar M-ring protein FliF